MPNRARRKSVVDMLARVPVHRGSLLKGIDDLMRTIEMSESAVMIPTLLRDKCQFDAWELLLVAKILKASILGHTDLVEFYMNHIGNQVKIQQQQAQTQLQPQQQQSSSLETGANSIDGSIHSSSPMVSFGSPSGNNVSQSSGSISWTTANNGNSFNELGKHMSNGSTSMSYVNSNNSSSSNLNLSGPKSEINFNTQPSIETEASNNDDEESLLAIQMSREIFATRPTRLDGLGNSSSPVAASQPMHPVGYSIEHLANRLEGMQSTLDPKNSGSLSVSTTPTLLSPEITIRSSRSASCLSRPQSGASSPRTANQQSNMNSTPTSTPLTTPDTPFPSSMEPPSCDQTSAPVKLLFQIEQLKASINLVKNQLESVVELYKRSIDNISLA